MNLYQHAKNQVISSISAEDKGDLKIQQSDWLGAFWVIFRELDFSQIWDFCMKTTNNINFHYRKNLNVPYKS